MSDQLPNDDRIAKLEAKLARIEPAFTKMKTEWDRCHWAWIAVLKFLGYCAAGIVFLFTFSEKIGQMLKALHTGIFGGR